MVGLERGTVELEPYQDEWQDHYETEVQRLIDIAGEWILNSVVADAKIAERDFRSGFYGHLDVLETQQDIGLHNFPESSPRANGLPRTTRSRHRRQQVLDPNQSMNLGGVSRKWGGDQNLTKRYVVSKQNSCDTAPSFIDLRPSGYPLTSRLCHGEVGR